MTTWTNDSKPTATAKTNFAFSDSNNFVFSDGENFVFVMGTWDTDLKPSTSYTNDSKPS